MTTAHLHLSFRDTDRFRHICAGLSGDGARRAIETDFASNPCDRAFEMTFWRVFNVFSERSEVSVSKERLTVNYCKDGCEQAQNSET